MAKQKRNKVNIGVRRRVSAYYKRFTLLLKITALLVILLLLFTNILNKPKEKFLQIFANILATQGFVFEHLLIVGKKNIPTKDIIDAIGSKGNTPIYSLNIEDIRVRIEHNSWVKAALIERRLPNTLYVGIIERTPVAIWQFEQKLYLIDEDGRRITSDNIDKFPNLLHVVGQDANVYARSLIEDLEKHPQLAEKIISAVRYGQRRWDLNLEQKINVKMPEKDFATAFDYLNSLYEANKLFDQNYKIINLKDINKYYLEKY